MPELPEVETIVRSLNNPARGSFSHPENLRSRPGVIGRTISTCKVYWPRTAAEPDVPTLQERICGQTILQVTRRGKFLVFSLTEDSLLIHLRMSGDIRVEEDQQETLQKHDRFMLSFEDGSRLVLNDPRKFGRVWLVDDEQRILGKLGLEPFSSEVTPITFLQTLLLRKRAIKTILMDQTFLAGMGNIYTDEALHLAGIHPLERSNNLDLADATRLLKAIREVLSEGIKRNGASIDWVYRGGDFQNYFKVYQRTGKPCISCGQPIERIVTGQRGTHFCPNCQTIKDTKL
jgi:formamidopyrimidine-DNA glycosylase